MKIKLSTIIYCVYLSFNINPVWAQINVEWQKCYGGSGYEFSYGVKETSDGGLIFIGSTSSNDGDVSGNHGFFDAWVVKTDIFGNLQWQKCIGGIDSDHGRSIIQVSDGGYLLQISTVSDDSIVIGNHGSSDILLVKLDSTGTIQWQRCYGGSGLEETGSCIEVSNGYLFIGSTDSNDGDVSGLTNSMGRDAWLVRIDYSGNILYQKCIYGLFDERGHTIEPTPDGNYLISGDVGNISAVCQGEVDSRILKVDSAGIILTEYCFGGPEDDLSYDAHITSDGKIIFIGTTSKNGGNVNGCHGTQWPDIWVVKQDLAGNVIWQKCLGGYKNEWGFNIIENGNGSFILTGMTSSVDGDLNSSYGYDDLWVVKLDAFGNIIYDRNFGGTEHDEGRYIIKTSDYKYVAAGSTSSNNIFVRGNHGHNDFWALKLSENYNSIKGKLFADNNLNQINDSNDLAIANKMISDTVSGQIAFSNISGKYNLVELNSGNFTVSPDSLQGYNHLPFSRNVTFTGLHQTDSMNDFAFQPAGNYNDLCVTVSPMQVLRPGFDISYSINYENAGTTVINGQIILFNDNRFSFFSSSVIPDQVTLDSIFWNIDTIQPFGSGQILLTFSTDSTIAVDDSITTRVRIEPVLNDVNPVCNFDDWVSIAIGSYDPNNITVDHSLILTSQLINPPFLNYVINFQNTGTDTAFNIKVMNNIPYELDMAGFVFTASSDPLKITYEPSSRLMIFHLLNILLPDSQVDEPHSHGFIRYRIKPLNTLIAGDTINNTGFIYFDHHLPVQTNYAQTTIINYVGINTQNQDEIPFSIYPNPALGNVFIDYHLEPGKPGELLVFDMTAHKLYSTDLSSKSYPNQVILPKLSNGVYQVVLLTAEKRFTKKLVVINEN